jgi:hypothetical protein
VADQELKWWHVRWRLAGRAISRFAIAFGKVIGVLCLVAGIGCGVIYLISPWLVSQRMIKVDPRLNIVPADLPTKAGAPLSNATIDLYGFRVTLPNEEIAKTLQGDFVTLVRFRNGGFLRIHNPSQDSGILEFAIGDKHAERLVGQEIIHSKFKLMQAAMWATAEQAKWWRFHNLENERVEYLLLTKFSVLTENESHYAFTLGPIYTISAGGFRGFQIGDPGAPPYEARLDLFDGADRYLALDVSGTDGHGKVLTQAEINAVVASIHPTAVR